MAAVKKQNAAQTAAAEAAAEIANLEAAVESGSDANDSESEGESGAKKQRKERGSNETTPKNSPARPPSQQKRNEKPIGKENVDGDEEGQGASRQREESDPKKRTKEQGSNETTPKDSPARQLSKSKRIEKQIENDDDEEGAGASRHSERVDKLALQKKVRELEEQLAAKDKVTMFFVFMVSIALTFHFYQASTPAPKRGRKRKSLVSNQSPGPVTVQPGDNLLLILKSGSNTRQIQETLVVRLISKVGHRWNNAASAGVGFVIVREIVKSKDVGGYGAIYDTLRKQDPKVEKKMLKQLRDSHQHALTNHRKHLREIISRLFVKTKDPKINFIKSSVFGVAGGAPIIGLDHPVVQGMMRSMQGNIRVFKFILLNCIHSRPGFDRGRRG